jgi:hypothetical protein
MTQRGTLKWVWSLAGVLAMLWSCDGSQLPLPTPPTQNKTSTGSTDKTGSDAGVEACIQPSVCPEGAVDCLPVELTCPDPTTNCCQPNGIGIYTDEGGSAGIGDLGLMITHFINTKSGVTFEGRYLRPGPPASWSILTGTVDGVDNPGENPPLQILTAISTIGSSTVPTVTFSTPTGAHSVNGTELYGLRLHISFPDPVLGVVTQSRRYLLELAAPVHRPLRPNLTAYNLRWRVDDLQQQPRPSPEPAWTQYCRDGGDAKAGGPHQPDAVVFHGGIDIDPSSGTVSRPAGSHVTMSCYLGAPAAVTSWGYPHLGSKDKVFYFDAGIHMKLAAFCGDSQFFTHAGVNIDVADDNAGSRSGEGPPLYLEAVWSPEGAICVNPQNVRDKPFTGCPHRPLTPCSDRTSLVGPYLASGRKLPPRSAQAAQLRGGQPDRDSVDGRPH